MTPNQEVTPVVGWQYRPGAFVYSSPHATVTLDRYTGPATASPAYRPDLAEALPGLSPFILWEWSQYRVTVAPPPQDEVTLLIGDQPVRPVAPGVYLFRYENALGASRIRLAGAPVPDLPVEVVSHKLSGPTLADYPRLYRAMVQEVTDALLTLPFNVTGPTAHATRAHGGPPSPLFTLHLLRHHGRTIRRALAAIERSPHRVLVRDEVVLPVARATRLDGAAVRWVLTHPESWATAAEAGHGGGVGGHGWAAPHSGGWFQYGDRAVLPVRLLQDRAEETFDTHENRFVRHFLVSLLRAVDGALALLARPGMGQSALRPELRALAAQLGEALAWPWWDQVGELVHVPETSTVLHGKDGYRELWALYPEFLAGRSPFGHGLDRAIAARDVATLYEYWCFFRLIAALEADLGPAAMHLRTDETGGLDWNAAARFGDGKWELVFNRPARGGRQSYSLGLRPDFTLIGPAGVELVLDAKFRLDAPRAEADGPGLDDPDRAEASPQAADLYKMHTYRDALGVRAAVALYPGGRAVFCDRRTRRRRSDLTLRDLIHGDFEGVGAIPLRPEGGHEA